MTKPNSVYILPVLLAVSTTASAQTEAALDARVGRMEERFGDLTQALEALLKTLSARQESPSAPEAATPPAESVAPFAARRQGPPERGPVFPGSSAEPFSDTARHAPPARDCRRLADGGPSVARDFRPAPVATPADDEIGRRMSRLEQRLAALIEIARQRKSNRPPPVAAPSPEDEARLAELEARAESLASILADRSGSNPADDSPDPSSGFPVIGDPSPTAQDEPPSSTPDASAVAADGAESPPVSPPRAVPHIVGPQNDAVAEEAPRQQQPLNAPTPRDLKEGLRAYLAGHLRTLGETEFCGRCSHAPAANSGSILKPTGLIPAPCIDDGRDNRVLTVRSQPHSVEVWRGVP